MISVGIASLRPLAVTALAVSACMALTSCNKAPLPGAVGASVSALAPSDNSAASVTRSASSAPPTAVDSGATDGATTAADAPAVGANGAAHACSLITQAEAATALGADPGPGEETTLPGGVSSCIFGQMPAMVTVNVVPTKGKAYLAHIASQSPGGKLAPISGVGDGAYAFSTGPSASVWFSKGDTFAAVGIIASGAPKGSSVGALALAKIAAGRL